MAKLKSRRAQKASLVLRNQVAMAYLTPRQLAQAVMDSLALLSPEEIVNAFPRLYKQPRIPSLFGNTWKNLEDEHHVFAFDLDEDQLAALFAGFIRENAASLKTFQKLRVDFEAKLVTGNYDSAATVLDTITAEFGESLWSVRNRMLLLSLKGDKDGMSEYGRVARERITDKFFHTLVNWCLLIGADPLLHVPRIVMSSIRELRVANETIWADVLTLLFVPTPLLSQQGMMRCLRFAQQFQMLDKLVICERYAANNFAISEHPSPGLRNLLVALKETNSSLESEGDEELCRSLIANYEQGRYSDLIRTFEGSVERIRYPATYVNLIAKAHVYDKSRSGLPPSVLKTLIEATQSLYDVSQSPNSAKDQINSFATMFVNFSDAPLYQLIPYLAMPHHFAANDRRYLAVMASSTARPATPLIATIISDNDPVLGHEYGTSVDELPAHRKIKSKLHNMLLDGATSRSDVIATMDAYSSVAPLIRDQYEVSAAALVATNELDELLTRCAAALSENPHAYTAFPMPLLVSHIENNSISNLDAVVVTHFYAKRIDQNKEYLLNETYEEYLLLNQSDRPLQIANSGLDSRKIIFLRDISTTETMDFLGSFGDSNDLRAERICILDYLRDNHLIDAESYDSERDEILSQVIVDTGAAEFSVHKIDVNDAAIRRKIYEDIASQLQLYRSLDDDADQKFFKLDDGPNNAAASVVAGDKDQVLLKILNIARDAFLYDEKHGLDKNLSAEIRHGFFSNLMRCRLEERHLITERDESGVFKPNGYWLSDDGIIAEVRLAAVDKALAWFSERVNELILEAEEWMKITEESTPGVRQFRFPTFIDEIERLRLLAGGVDDVDAIIDECLTLLWVKTDIALENIRERINSDLHRKIGDLFEGLYAKLDEARMGVPLLDLFDAVGRAKNEIREDITTVAEWFRRADPVSGSSRSVPDLIDIALECHTRVRAHRLSTTDTSNHSLEDVHIGARGVKAFLLALINIFENCMRHSGYGFDTHVEISGVRNDSEWLLTVANEVVDEKLHSLTANYMQGITEKFSRPGGRSLARTEGGSGLKKAVNELSSISDQFRLSISLDGKVFSTRIEYDAVAAC